MTHQWTLLREEEIKALSPEELREYLIWVNEYKEERSQELAHQKKLLHEAYKNKEEMAKEEDKQHIQELLASL